MNVDFFVALSGVFAVCANPRISWGHITAISDQCTIPELISNNLRTRPGRQHQPPTKTIYKSPPTPSSPPSPTPHPSPPLPPSSSPSQTSPPPPLHQPSSRPPTPSHRPSSTPSPGPDPQYPPSTPASQTVPSSADPHPLAPLHRRTGPAATARRPGPRGRAGRGGR